VRRPTRAVLGAAALAGLVAVAGALAIALHRNGHSLGDDYALYLRQARSLFDGDPAQVVSDNRFTVLNSKGRISPYAYPWGWPLVLAPFVHLWGLDYDRLKLVVVALFCTWLVLVHGIVRRRGGRTMALLLVGAIGLSTAYLEYTDRLLSEYPYLVVVAVTVWWIDRIQRSELVDRAPLVDLAVLGALAAAAFNVRREGIVLVGVIAATQVAALAVRAQRERRTGGRAAVTLRRLSWARLAMPYGAFAASVVTAQLLLPTDLLPDNGDGPGYIDDRLWHDYPAVLTRQLGLGAHRSLGLVILAVALVGVVVRCRRSPVTDVPLAALMGLSALAVSTHFRLVERYYLQVTPWVLYFAVSALAAAAQAVAARRPAWGPWLVRTAIAAPLVALVAVHVAVVPGDVADARDFDRAGRVQLGPTHPDYVPIFEAVRTYTAPDDVVAYFKARTMTLLTERRAVQGDDLEMVLRNADWFAMQRGSTRSQPLLSASEAAAAGLTAVWQDEHWVLWRVDRPAAAQD
jgi:hypothetical protein